MGANESKEVFKSIVKVTLYCLSLTFYFVFVAFTKSIMKIWRSLAQPKGLNSELEAANKEGECVRQRLRHQDQQLERVKEQKDTLASEDQKNYGNLLDFLFIASFLHPLITFPFSFP